MTVTMHLCRGNYKSTFMGAGGYDAMQEVLFDRIKVHGYFMEYDTERAGGFEPLKRLPKGRIAVLGLVTTKTGALGSEGRHQAPHRGGGQIHRSRPALPVAAMRLRLDRGRQYPRRGRTMGEAPHDRRGRAGGVGPIGAVRMTIVYDKLMALDIAPVEQTYDAKDCMLYALGVGLGHDPMNENELAFVYEKNLKVLPTMATVVGHSGALAA